MYFLIYAFLGWCTEVAYKAVTTGEFINRGFLNGPVCPIYGFGMLLIIWVLEPVKDNFVLLLLGGIILATVLEFVTGYALEKMFHAKWWDYSELPFNIKGYVCLKFSLAWGFGCVLIMEAVHPLVAVFVNIMPIFMIKLFCAAGLAVMGVDTAITVNTVMKINKQAETLEELGAAMRKISDQLGESIFENVTDMKEKGEAVRESIEEREELLEEKVKDVREKLEERREEAAARIEERREENALRMEERREETIREHRERMNKLRADLANLGERYKLAEEERHIGAERLVKAFPNIRHRNADGYNRLRMGMKRAKTMKKNGKKVHDDK